MAREVYITPSGQGEERLASLNKGNVEYFVWEGEWHRAYKAQIIDGELKVEVKHREKVPTPIDYEKSKETKDALFCGYKISEEDYNNFVPED